MSISSNRKFEETSFLSKSNSSFIEQMYLKYLNKDIDLPEGWKKYFESLSEETSIAIKELKGPSWGIKSQHNKQQLENIVFEKKDNGLTDNENFNTKDFKKASNESIKAIALVRAYRIRGHLIANLDPLGMMERKYIHELHPEDHGFKKENYNKKIFLGSYMDTGGYSSINEILTKLRKIYCSGIGVEYMHISDPTEKVWFRNRMEKKENELKFTDDGKKAILKKIIQAEGFEKFLAKKFVGTKRFGLDGAESLIPALEQIIKRGGQLGVKEIKIGMPHRGRLNVLANVLQKSYKRIFNEFAGELFSTHEESAGDVKYHLGASSDREFDGNSVHISSVSYTHLRAHET